ncbi:MAG: hypothetical protein IKE45_07910 [Halomonas sp.]|nr:hypothetical protein [Halomonas sp.]MBR2513936.1 hypothetical protein [Halomonas sp.]
MHNALTTQRPNAKPETAFSAWVSECVSALAFVYAAYWFSHGVPLADR